MGTAFKYLIIIATVHSVAIFLCAETYPIVLHVQGKSEVIQGVESNETKIVDLQIEDIIQYGDLICTGKGSRTEIHHDNIIYRLGSMSVATWESDHSIKLLDGSFLFCSSKDANVTISSTEGSAKFSGSGTIIFETTQNGGFKFIPIEARGTLQTSKGGIKEVRSGRMILVLGEPTYFGDAYDIDLMLMIKTSRLLNSFPDPLPSFGRISLAIYAQALKLKGKFNALIGDAPTKDNLQMWKFDTPEDEKKSKSLLNRLIRKN